VTEEEANDNGMEEGKESITDGMLIEEEVYKLNKATER
jgi:hypothetical protein